METNWKESEATIKCPWGIWHVDNGLWEPNEKLIMSRDEQHKQNVVNGFSCKHGYMPTLCPYCN